MNLATREAFGNALIKLKDNTNVVVLDADLAHATKTKKFADTLPNRFFNMGIAEADMIGTAAGLAVSGKIPFACTFAVFATGRAFDQIRNSVCYPNLNVKVVGTHAGISVGEDGGTHQAIEDMALMRSLPNMTVIHPSDDIEAEQAVLAAVKHQGPIYLRLSRIPSPTLHSEDYQFKIGKGEILKEGKDVAIIATGLMVTKSLEAYEILKQQGIKATVINMPTIKPLDEDLIINLAKDIGKIITAEEHSIYGGLGSAISEVVSVKHPTKMVMIGIKDRFGKSGNPTKLFEEYELTAQDIVNAVNKITK